MNRHKVEEIKLINENAEIIKYKLFTKSKEIILNISKKDISKMMMLEFIKTPFFILSFNTIKNEIKVEDSFEISNDIATLELECQASCGLNLENKQF